MLDSRLAAIDPPGCGCTECMIGEYRPADRATDDELQALFLGLVRDNTSGHWTITQEVGDGFDITGPVSGHVETIIVPIPVEHYTLSVGNETVVAIALGAKRI